MNIQEAAKKLLAGELVVFPTETVYGLGALANNDNAVKNIFAVKGRPSMNPLIVHIADRTQLVELVQDIPFDAEVLMTHFWPGPLTICFKKSANVSDLVTGGLQSVCIRCPSHPIAQELLKCVGKSVAAPSANLSGKPSTTTFEDAKKQLEQRGVYFLDGGQSPLGIESTVVDCTEGIIKILRPGVISREQIEAVVKEQILDESISNMITSPGQLLEHYAPQGRLTVITGEPEKRRAWIESQSFPSTSQVAFGLVGLTKPSLTSAQKFSMVDNEDDLSTYTARLYRFLNWCDDQHATHIILELPSKPHPLLTALLNRLEKASRGNIIRI